MSNFSSNCSSNIPANSEEEDGERNIIMQHMSPILHEVIACVTCQHEEDAEARKTHIPINKASVLLQCQEES